MKPGDHREGRRRLVTLEPTRRRWMSRRRMQASRRRARLGRRKDRRRGGHPDVEGEPSGAGGAKCARWAVATPGTARLPGILHSAHTPPPLGRDAHHRSALRASRPRLQVGARVAIGRNKFARELGVDLAKIQAAAPAVASFTRTSSASSRTHSRAARQRRQAAALAFPVPARSACLAESRFRKVRSPSSQSRCRESEDLRREPRPHW